MDAIVVEHALAQHHLSIVRNRDTSTWHFRHSLTQLSTMAAIRATAKLELQDVDVDTPLARTSCQRLAKRIGLIPILRAGMIMVDPLLNLVPHAEVWHLGLFRDEATALPVPYYNKLPAGSPVDVALVLDPMLATGGSACMACSTLREWGARQMILVSVIAAPEGIGRVNEEFPETAVYTCAIDRQLDENRFIVPGLGDAGDRVYNTI